MTTVVIVIHLMVVLAMIGLVLLQRSEGGALGIGGGQGAFMTGRSAGNVLTRSTAVLAIAFFATSLGLALIAKYQSHPADILERIPGQATPTDDRDAGAADSADRRAGQRRGPAEAARRRHFRRRRRRRRRKPTPRAARRRRRRLRPTPRQPRPRPRIPRRQRRTGRRRRTGESAGPAGRDASCRHARAFRARSLDPARPSGVRGPGSADRPAPESLAHADPTARLSPRRLRTAVAAAIGRGFSEPCRRQRS